MRAAALVSARMTPSELWLKSTDTALYHANCTGCDGVLA